jgi:hypothetical protein
MSKNPFKAKIGHIYGALCIRIYLCFIFCWPKGKSFQHHL